MDLLNILLHQLRSEFPDEDPAAFDFVRRFLLFLETLQVEPAPMKAQVVNLITNAIFSVITARRDMPPEVRQHGYSEAIFMRLREAISVGGAAEPEIFAAHMLLQMAYSSSPSYAGMFVPFVCRVLAEMREQTES